MTYIVSGYLPKSGTKITKKIQAESQIESIEIFKKRNIGMVFNYYKSTYERPTN